MENLSVRLVDATTLFHTPVFRKCPKVMDIARRVGSIFVTQDPEYPGHFGAFFGYMLDPDDKKYPNPHIRDLRVLHDLTHTVYWKENPLPEGYGYADWSRWIIDAEMYASLVTECLVYFWIPGLRASTFPHEIWVDRYFNRVPQLKLTPMLEYRIAAARLKAMKTPDPDDVIEIGISEYLRQNRDWCVIWGQKIMVDAGARRPAFRVVGDHMSAVFEGKVTLEEHASWLRFFAGHASSGPVETPFAEQAEAFRPVYERTGKASGNYLLST